MRSFSSRALTWALAVVGLLSAGAVLAPAQETPLAGNWKVTILPMGREITIWLVQIEEKDGKQAAKVLSVTDPRLKDSKVESVTVQDGTLRLTLASGKERFEVVARAPKGEKTSKLLLGSISEDGSSELLQLEKTDVKELDPKTANNVPPTTKAFFKAFQDAKGQDEVEQVFKDFLKEHAKAPLAHNVAVGLLKMQVKKGAKEADLKALAEQAVAPLEPYGRQAKLRALSDVARELSKSKEANALTLDYARQAEKTLSPSDPATARLPVLQTLAKALGQAGKADEAKELNEQVAKLNETLDKEFAKTAVPFEPEPFAGRKGKSDRTVVLELFTGAQCPPCVSADVAFDALLKTYKPADVVLLQYHLHIPGPDPLTNRDSEKRARFYDVNSTPTVFINGEKGPAVGGRKPDGEDRYKELRGVLAEKLEAESQGKVMLKAVRKGDKIDISAEVAGLKKAGKEVRLRFVLVENVVRYAGSNGQRFHHHVVRALPGGEEGFALEAKDGKHTATLDLKELAKSLDEYLTKSASEQPFRDDARPLELSNLKVVALVQDNDSREILAAAQVGLPGAKND